MLHFSIPSRGNKGYSCARILFLALSFCLLQQLSGLPVFAETNQISAVTGKVDGSNILLRIKGSAQPTFTVYELFKPARIIVDIADSDFVQTLQTQLPESTQIEVSTRIITDTTPSLARLEFILPQSLPFTTTQEDNDIIVTVSQQANSTAGSQEDVTGQSATVIKDIKILTEAKQTKVRLLANGPLDNYKYDVLERKGNAPPRLFIDLNNVSGESLLQEQMVGTSLAKIRVAKRGSGLRIVMDSASREGIFPFTIQKIPSGLEVTIDEPQAQDQLSGLINENKAIASQLPVDIDPLEKQLSPEATAQQIEDAFSFSGYQKERITVDFYKIDLHNVFRLIGEISGINIVVDEGVSGALTLALNDVPWDFALDIIMNLKDLQKEERFNTLVIVPKDKGFAWPEQAQNNLSFEADEEVVEQEALLIKQQQSLPKEVVEAKQQIAKAQKFDKRGDYETAIRLYEQALELWPDNTKLANRIASLYLVQLRQNAKAVFFAKKALAADPENHTAALNAAIALANMQESQQALEFFDQSISGEKPSAAALFSYASFSEGQKEYAGALKILQKHDELYGKNLNSMVATARIYDKKGEPEMATKKYEAILHAGFRIPPDLVKYIKGRIALKQSM